MTRCPGNTAATALLWSLALCSNLTAVLSDSECFPGAISLYRMDYRSIECALRGLVRDTAPGMGPGTPPVEPWGEL